MSPGDRDAPILVQYENSLICAHPIVSTMGKAGEDMHEKRLNETLKVFYNRYDRDGNGVIDQFELKFLLKDIGEDILLVHTHNTHTHTPPSTPSSLHKPLHFFLFLNLYQICKRTGSMLL